LKLAYFIRVLCFRNIIKMVAFWWSVVCAPSILTPTGGEVSKSGVDNGGNVDEEAVEVTEDNPLFEGNKEMRKKLYILCPAVAIGVSFQLIHFGCAKQVGRDIN